MVASRLAAASLIASLSISGCCETEDEVDPGPVLIGPRIYALYPGFCGQWCWTFVLYRSADELLELRAFEAGELIGSAQADLHEDTAAAIDAQVQLILDEGVGAPQSCHLVDAPIVELPLPELTLSYAAGCPPAGVEQLDALLAQLLDDLQRCRATERISPKIGCVELDPFTWEG